jgi:hypothetical protein
MPIPLTTPQYVPYGLCLLSMMPTKEIILTAGPQEPKGYAVIPVVELSKKRWITSDCLQFIWTA